MEEKNKAMTEEERELLKRLDFRLAHVGINSGTPEAAYGMVAQFTELFGFGLVDKNKGAFADTYVECMKVPGRGLHGHIGFSTEHLDEAIAYLEGKGVHFYLDKETAPKDANGQYLGAIYMDREIGGFALHILQRR